MHFYWRARCTIRIGVEELLDFTLLEFSCDDHLLDFLFDPVILFGRDFIFWPGSHANGGIALIGQTELKRLNLIMEVGDGAVRLEIEFDEQLEAVLAIELTLWIKHCL